MKPNIIALDTTRQADTEALRIALENAAALRRMARVWPVLEVTSRGVVGKRMRPRHAAG